MSVKTRLSQKESLNERGTIADLFASALVLIRGNKRSELQRSNLRRALQLFQENRLAGVLAGGPEVSADTLQELLSLEIAQLLPASAATHFRNNGVKYVGELYLLPYDTWRSARSLKNKSVQTCRQVLGELGLPFEFDLATASWMPPYATDPAVLELWASPRHTMQRERCCTLGHSGGTCGSIGEWLRKGRVRANGQWSIQLKSIGLHSCMYVPSSWIPPRRNSEACNNFGYTMWDGARLEDEIVEILERAGFKTLTSLTQISRSALREILGGQSMIGILEGMRRRGLSLLPVSEDEKDIILLPLDTTFSLRTGNCFKNEGVTTVGQLMEFTEAELLQWPNFGRKSLNETKDFLATLGLALKQ